MILGNSVRVRLPSTVAVAITMLMLMGAMSVSSPQVSAASATMQTDKSVYLPGETITVTSSWSGCSYRSSIEEPNVYWIVGGVFWQPSSPGQSGSDVHHLNAADFSYGAHTIEMDYAWRSYGQAPYGYYDYYTLYATFYVDDAINPSVAVSSSDRWSGFVPNDATVLNQTVLKTATGAQLLTGVDTTTLAVGANLRQINFDQFGNPILSMIVQTHATIRGQISYDQTSRAAEGPYYETYFNTGGSGNPFNIWNEIRKLPSKDKSQLNDDSGFMVDTRSCVYDDFRLLYWGKWYDSLYVSSNGFVIPISAEEWARSPCPYNVDRWNSYKPDETSYDQMLNPVSIPSQDGVDGVIAPYWTDLNIDHDINAQNPGKIYYGWLEYPYGWQSLEGDVMSFVVAWDHVSEQVGTGNNWISQSFAVVFQFDPRSGTNGGDGNIWWRMISFIYGDVDTNPNTKTVIGVENQEGTKGVTYPKTSVVDEWVVKFEPNLWGGYVIKDIDLLITKELDNINKWFDSEIYLYGPGGDHDPPATGYNIINIDSATEAHWEDLQDDALKSGVKHLGMAAGEGILEATGVTAPLGATGRVLGGGGILFELGSAYEDFSYALKELPFPDYNPRADNVADDGYTPALEPMVWVKTDTLDYGLPHDVERQYYPYDWHSYSAFDCVLCTRVDWKITDMSALPLTLKIKAVATVGDFQNYFPDDETLDTSQEVGWLDITLNPSPVQEPSNPETGHWWLGRTVEDGHYFRFGSGTTTHVPGHTEGLPFFFMDCSGRPAADFGYSMMAWNKVARSLANDYSIDKDHYLLNVHGHFKKVDSDPLYLYVIKRSSPSPPPGFPDYLGDSDAILMRVELLSLTDPTFSWVTVDKTLDLSQFTNSLSAGQCQYLKIAVGMVVEATAKSYRFGLAGVQISTPAAPLSVTGNPLTASGVAPLTVQFTCTPSGGIPGYTYLWNFGDGSATSTVQNPSPHTYSLAGSYVATVTVTDSILNTKQWTSSISVSLSVTGSASPTSGPYPLSVAFTSSVVGATGQCSYSWAFGDGGTSTAANPNHIYLTAGTYTATVIVSDSASHSAQWTSPSITVTVPPITVSGSAAPTSGTAPLSVAFTCTPSGGLEPYAYSWAFGDGGTSAERNPTHVYSSAGTYTAVVTVTGSGGSGHAHWTSPAIVVAAPPLSVIGMATPTSGTAPLTVQFTCTPSGGSPPYQYSWSYGDGTSDSSVKDPTHTYTSQGTYVATVTVTAAGEQAQWSSPSITVSTPNLPPTAVISGPSSGQIGKPLTFSGSGSYDPDGTIATFSWNFGDGGTATGSQVIHSYQSAGQYTVTLTVIDNDGATGTANTQVSITAPPVRLTVNAGYYNARGVWYPLTGTVWVDGVPGSTGVAVSVSAGTHTVQVQDPIKVGKKTYYFLQWQGGVPSTNPGTITISGDTTLNAVFSTTAPPPPGYTVTVNAYYWDGSVWKAVTSAWVKIDGVTVGKTGGTFRVNYVGTCLLEVQNPVKIAGKYYVFSYFDGEGLLPWGPPATNPGTFYLMSDVTITAYYVLA